MSAAAARRPWRRAIAWPAPRSRSAVRELLVDAERRGDPFAAAHLVAGLAYCAVAALWPQLGDVALGLLLLVRLLRIPALQAADLPFLASPLPWLLLALAAWGLLGALWTPDLAEWTDQVRAFRALLVPWLLWPLRLHARALVAAVVIGGALQGGMQVVEFLAALGEAPEESHARFAGLLHHPGHATMLAATGLLLLPGLVATGGAAARRLAVPAVALLGTGLLLGAGRGALLGLAVGAPITLLLLIRGPWGESIRRLGRPLAWAGAAVLLVAVLLSATGALRSLTWQFLDRRNLVLSPSGSFGQRLVWWQAALELAPEHPLRGGGLGFFAFRLGGTDAVEEAIAATSDPWVASHLKAAHPHSAYLHAIVDLGVPGVLLLGSILLVAGAGAARLARDSALGAGLVGCLALWTVAFAFETPTLNGAMLGLFMILVALSAPPAPPPLLGGPRPQTLSR